LWAVLLGCASDVDNTVLPDLPLLPRTCPKASVAPTGVVADPDAAQKRIANLPAVLAPIADPDIKAQYGRWKVLKELKPGAFGKVAIAWDGARYAVLKILNKKQSPMMPEFWIYPRFQAEVNFQYKLGAKGIAPQVYELLLNDRKFYVVANEFMSGGNLKDFINDNPLLPDEQQMMVLQLAAKMHQMHAMKIAHRDIKPDNLLVDKATKEVFISDFGEATTTDSDTHQKCRRGDYTTMAPELGVDIFQVWNRDLAAMDAYSLGLTILFVLTKCSLVRRLAEVYGIVGSAPKSLRFPMNEDIKAHACYVRLRTPEEKAMIEGLLETDWTKRWTMTDLLKSKYLRGAAAKLRLIRGAAPPLVRAGSDPSAGRGRTS
jgi:serine/threonine protein kinase